MKSPNLLNLGNARKVKKNLSQILDQAALDKLEAEIAANAADLYALGQDHYRFAVKQSSSNWRQKVSRLYYAAYNVTRAIRLYVLGEYSTDVKDHQRFDKLPSNFPHRLRYANQLAVLREDRNTSDYDHTSCDADLALGATDSAGLVEDFLNDARSYLQEKGLSV